MLSEKIYAGQHIGEYRVIATMSSSPSSSLYQAEHTLLEQPIVALRLLQTSHFSEQRSNQFLKEVQVLKRLNHAHILPILDSGIFEGMPYLVREYAQGGSLRDRIKSQNAHPLPTQEALAILAQVGQALQYAHQFNIVHANLKPENILFDEENCALLADFSIVTTRDAFNPYHQANSLPYMAPEQFQGWMTRECDQYALGCIAYELLTGKLPLPASDFLQFKHKHATEKPIAPTQLNLLLPISLEEAVLKAMEKKSEDRYPSIKDFVSSLAASSTTHTHSHLPTLVSGQYSIDLANPPSPKPFIFPTSITSATKHARTEPETVTIQNESTETISPLSTPMQPYKLKQKPLPTSLPINQKSASTAGTQTRLTTSVPPSQRVLLNASAYRGRNAYRPLWFIFLSSLVIVVIITLSVLHFALTLSPSHLASPTSIAQNSLPTPTLTLVLTQRAVPTLTPAPAPKLAGAPAPTPFPTPTSLASPTPSPTPNPTLKVTPTSLRAETACQKSGAYYICTVTLLLPQTYSGNLKWYAADGNLSVFFNPARGTLAPGQQQPVTAEVLSACPHTGTLNFFSKDGEASVQWVC